MNVMLFPKQNQEAEWWTANTAWKILTDIMKPIGGKIGSQLVKTNNGKSILVNTIWIWVSINNFELISHSYTASYIIGHYI